MPINYTITTPDRVEARDWQAIHDLTKSAFKDEGGSVLVQLTHARFVKTRTNPNLLVGEELAANQEFNEPHVVIGREEGEIVGYSYTALNISGSGAARAVKRLLSPAFLASKEFVWHRELVVDPDHRHQGIGSALIAIGLSERDLRHPSTAYVVKKDDPDWYAQLLGLGFEDTSDAYTISKRLEAPSRLLKRELVADPVRQQHIRQALINVDRKL